MAFFSLICTGRWRMAIPFPPPDRGAARAACATGPLSSAILRPKIPATAASPAYLAISSSPQTVQFGALARVKVTSTFLHSWTPSSRLRRNFLVSKRSISSGLSDMSTTIPSSSPTPERSNGSSAHSTSYPAASRIVFTRSCARSLRTPSISFYIGVRYRTILLSAPEGRSGGQQRAVRVR